MVRIRQGYFYTFDGSTFQVFRFETRIDDDNSSLYREDTETHKKPAYTFTKYKWDSLGVESQWTLSDESYPYAFVPRDTPVAWVAYSEIRWPYRFFYQAELNETFRNKLMTKIDLSSRSGPYCAPITELEQRVPAFRKDSATFEVKDYTLTNAIRLTSVEVERSSSVIKCDNTKEKGVLVALHDPIGEMQDLLGLMSVHSQTLTNYLSEHQYPLIMGKAVNNYVVDEKVSTTWLRFWDGELSKSFETEYKKLLSHADDLETSQEYLAKHWMSIAVQTGFGSIGALFKNAEIITDLFSIEGHPLDHTETVSYWLFQLARIMTPVASSVPMSQSLVPLFTGRPDWDKIKTPPPSGWEKVKEYFDKGLKLSTASLAIGQKAHMLFKPTLSAVFSVYGAEIIRGAAVDGSPTQLITKLIYQKKMNYHKADELKDAFKTMMTKEGYGNASAPKFVELMGERITGSTLINEAANGKIGVVEFHNQLDINVSSEYLRHARNANTFELGSNGFAIVGAGLSLYTTISKWNAPLRASSGIGRIALDPRTQLIAAFSEAYAGLHGAANTLIGRSNPAAVRAVGAQVFKGNAALSGSVAANGSRVARAISSKPALYAAKLAGAVGVVMSAFMVVEGLTRGDKAMYVGNGLMLAGGLVLLMVTTGPLALIAVAAIAIGVVFTFFSLDEAERWVQDGFWGTSSTYWGGEERVAISEQIHRAKVMANTNSVNYQTIKQYFEAELETYIDINADLKLEDSAPHDGMIEVHCGILQTAAHLSRLRVSAYVDWTFSNPSVAARSEWRAPGVAVIYLTKPNISDNGSVQIDVEVDRTHNGQIDGKFTADLRIESHKLWR